jgi:hypothetical protein
LSNPSSSSSYQVLLSFHTEKKSHLRPARPPIFSLSQTTTVDCERDSISSQKSPQTRNALKTESTYSRIITTCDAARIFFSYTFFFVSVVEIVLKVCCLSLRVFFLLFWFVVSFPRFFCFFCFFFSSPSRPPISLAPRTARYLHTHTHTYLNNT